jgi:hypothetical protein
MKTFEKKYNKSDDSIGNKFFNLFKDLESQKNKKK